MENVLQKALGFACMLSLLWVGCSKKEADLSIDSEEAYTLTFKLKGFSAEINPLSFRSASTLSTENEVERYLYFWSFNEENTLPDEAIHSTGATIDFLGAEQDFTTGWGASPYPPGKGYNVKGAQHIIITMPLTGTSQLLSLAFDAGSSGTGPKNFKLYYSTDGGVIYSVLSEDNQFSNFGTNARNRFEYDLSQLSGVNYEGNLMIKMEPFEGERGGDGAAYNPNTGTFKIDNFRLSGMYPPSGGDSDPVEGVNKIHYYIFDAENHTLVADGEMSFHPSQINPELSVRLPKGEYYASILSNSSHADLILPASITQASEFYIGNPFTNQEALIFGAVIPDLVVDESTQLEVTLKRYFSEVSFEFTDETDLFDIGRIRIIPEQDDFFYNPFTALPGIPAPAPSMIDIIPAFTADQKRIFFHQFIGEVLEPVPVSYSIEVYDRDQSLLREFSVGSSLKNNMQLLFRGLLLEGVDHSHGFQIRWNEEWDDSRTEIF